MKSELEQKAYCWITADKKELLSINGENYCQTRDAFQVRLDKMISALLDSKEISEEDVYIIAAIAGEIGNNSFDHNLGSWPDIPGVFFSYEFFGGMIIIVLADRGQGLQATLKRVKPEIKNDSQALFTAFNERISGRAPEPRGNGLKFVKENIKDRKMRLIFASGLARAELNQKMIIEETVNQVKGTLAAISYQYEN